MVRLSQLPLSIVAPLLLLSACSKGSMQTRTGQSAKRPPGTPLLDAIPRDAQSAVVLRQEAMVLWTALYGSYPGLQAKLAAFSNKHLGVDLSQAKGAVTFQRAQGPESQCTYYHMPGLGLPKAKPVGDHGGVALLDASSGGKEGDVMAVAPGGLLVGAPSSVKAALDRMGGKTPALALGDPLGELRFADNARVSALMGLSQQVTSKLGPKVKNAGIEGVSLTFDQDRRMVLRIKGPLAKLGILETELNAALAAALLKLTAVDASRKRGLWESANGVIERHVLLHHGKEIAPVVEQGRLVSRLQFPAEGTLTVAMMLVAVVAQRAMPSLTSLMTGGLPGAQPAEGGKVTAPVATKATEPKPSAKPRRVVATVLTDKRCKACKVAGLEKNLRSRFFPGLVVKVLDYNSKEGRRLYKQLSAKYPRLPQWVFAADTNKARKFSSISRWMNRLEDGRYRLRVPAPFDPTAEICDNGRDDTNNGKVDCKDPTCKKTLVCRKEKKRNLQVFVMSQCPFAATGLLALREVKKKHRRMRFEMHYIVDQVKEGKKCRRGPSRFGFCALHGADEVDENIRQLCAKKHYQKRDKYLEYVWCRAKDYRSSDWKKCARRGIRARVIERCFKGQGQKLLAKDRREAELLGISGSPTWLANNRVKFGGISVEAITKGFCGQNPKLRRCKKWAKDQAKKPAKP